MRKLTTIYRSEKMNPNQNTLRRNAARAVIIIENKLLLIKSSKYGEYKFPGGGIEMDETPQDALIREVLEEVGREVIPTTIKELGTIVEIDRDTKGPYDFYEQTSYYYFCEVTKNILSQNLSEAEQFLGYNIELVDIDMALQNNEALEYHNNIRWNLRETWMLNYLKENYLT